MIAFRTDTTELGDARRRVEELVTQLSTPSATAEQSFEHPWQLRAFAMAVAAYDSGQYEWAEFQLSLINSIERWEGADDAGPWEYYEHWLNALENVLGGKGLLSGTALDDRTASVLSTPSNANHHEAHTEPVAIDPARTRSST